MGTDRSGSGAALGLRLLSGPAAARPPAERLYGRRRGRRLRPRQQLLLDLALPRLRLPEGDPRAAFPGATALWLEVGSGSGEHSLAQIAAHPEIGLIACEVFVNGLCSLLSRLAPEGSEATAPLPSNLRVFDQDARELLRRLPDAALDRLFLLFPDPWPKARHAKRRFVHPENLALIARLLKPGAEWRIATDDPTYQAWVAHVMAAQSEFAATAPSRVRPADWPPTRYEAKALREGRAALYWSLRRL